ncbi:MFS transporter [Bifidobacterium lemurum]|uniref:MFS transporter n=1 Tax=Bifidobacterium lemurum TaxID=1603886 RepID=A0A261FS51_9BIFI|nr:MFS transporter [Bifidobacterium lemurum]OZG62014.1 MFS transporter [Bifidobacterium lemurum]QOL34847.1 MFS transporter [Bifidobacterium lemurum]
MNRDSAHPTESRNIRDSLNRYAAHSTRICHDGHDNRNHRNSNRNNTSPLRSRDFVLLVAGQGISLFGNMTLRFAMSMWVLDETGSATAFATVLAVSIVPTILLSPLGGVLADRVNRRTIMVALDAASGALVLACALVFAALGFNIAAVAAMQILLAVLGAFETPTVQAALPQLLRGQDSGTLRQGMAVVNQVQQLASLLPSFLGGVLYSFFGIHLMMCIAVASFVLAAALECFIRLGNPRGAADAAVTDATTTHMTATGTAAEAANHAESANLLNQTNLPVQPDQTDQTIPDGTAPNVTVMNTPLPSVLDDLKAGVRFLIYERPNILKLMMFAAILNFVVAGYSAVGFPYIIRTVLGFDATVYGFSDGILGVAGVAGAFIAGTVAARLTIDHMAPSLYALALALIPQGIAFVLPIGNWAKLAVLVAFSCAVVIACSFTNLIAIPAIQLRTPQEMTGKVMSLASSLAMCAQPLGQMLYGWAYDRFPVAAVLLVSGLAMIALTLIGTPIFHHFDD